MSYHDYYGSGGYYQGDSTPGYYGAEGQYGYFNTGSQSWDQFGADLSSWDPVGSWIGSGLGGALGGDSGPPNYSPGTNPSDPRWGGNPSFNGRPLTTQGGGEYWSSWDIYDPNRVGFDLYSMTAAAGMPGNIATNQEASRDASMARYFGWFQPNADGSLPSMQEAMRRREGRAAGFQGAQLGAINQGYGKASRQLEGLGSSAYRDIGEQQAQLQRGTSQDAQRQRQNVMEQVSTAQSGLTVDYTKALAGQYGSMGAFQTQMGQQEQGIANSLIGGIYNDEIVQAGGGSGSGEWAQYLPLLLALL